MMLLLNRSYVDTLERQTSDLRARIEQLERAQAELRKRIDGETQLRHLCAGITAAAQAAPAIGAAMEGFAAAMRAPWPRGRAGGRARAAQAKRLMERWEDGRYMSHDDWEDIEREIADAEYMRNAAGGFARAASARRNPDGTFAPRADVASLVK